jgi:hypothetical protein
MTKINKPLKPETLEAEGYSLFNSFPHQELVAFILPFTKKKNKYMHIYNAGMILPMLVFFGTFGYILGSGEGIKQHLEGIGFYIGAVVLLIPVHELIHGIAYKWVGAPKVSYGVLWKQLAFFAQADDYVVNFREFRIVALAPFIVISSALIIAMFLSDMDGLLGFSLMLGLHNGVCAGDFALLSFFHENRDKEIVTYDDASEGKTYFYQRKLAAS